MKHIISILLENESGALSRVSGLFSARGYNIESLTVAPTNDPTLSRMTLVTSGTEEIVDQIIKQLNKLVDVVKLMDLTDYPHLARELLLVKVAVFKSEQVRVKHLADIFKARILDVTPAAYTIELTGNSDKLDAFLEALDDMEIMEVVRSGAMGIARGEVALVL
ncbi:MAG: acetolactate synthase small subunit [bacterium]